jgi:hypothetical protein
LPGTEWSRWFWNQIEKTKEQDEMKVGQYTSGNERDEFLSLKDGQKATVKIIRVSEPIKTDKFNGLFLTVKMGDKKFAKSLSFGNGAIDLNNVCRQLGTDETDDWPGESIQVVGVKASKKNDAGKYPVFVNVVNPSPKKKGKK